MTQEEAVARSIAPIIMWEFDGWPLKEAVDWEKISPKDQAKLCEIARAAIAAMPSRNHDEQADSLEEWERFEVETGAAETAGYTLPPRDHAYSVADQIRKWVIDRDWPEEIRTELLGYMDGIVPNRGEQRSSEDEEEEAYQIGKDEGFANAVQKIDELTGGDGVYRACLGIQDERHCPDPETMIQRIVERFEEAASRSSDGSGILDEVREVLGELLSFKLACMWMPDNRRDFPATVKRARSLLDKIGEGR